MNQRLIKLHKGVDNLVKFKVFDSDRKVTMIDDLRVVATLINVENRERVLQKQCKITSKRGILELIVSEGDLINLSPGFYSVAITGQEFNVPEIPGDIISTPFYTNTVADIQLTAEVIASVDKTPIPTIEILPHQWIRIEEGVGLHPEYRSSAYPANRLKNYAHGTHTVAFYLDNFTGTVEVLGTLEQVPTQKPSDYFRLNMTSLQNVISYDQYTGIDAYSFQANVMWIMFRYIPDPLLSVEQRGKIEKVQLRS